MFLNGEKYFIADIQIDSSTGDCIAVAFELEFDVESI